MTSPAPVSPHPDEQRLDDVQRAALKAFIAANGRSAGLLAAVAAVRPLIEAATQQHIHDRIVAELVCCHTYDDGDPDKAEKAGHAICYWGEAAARIALNPDQET